MVNVKLLEDKIKNDVERHISRCDTCKDMKKHGDFYSYIAEKIGVSRQTVKSNCVHFMYGSNGIKYPCEMFKAMGGVVVENGKR